jgi:hypothetical protein
MRSRGSRIGHPIWPSTLILGTWLLGLSVVVWRSWGHSERWLAVGHNRRSAALRPARSGDQASAPSGLDDPRLRPLREAAEIWRRSTAPSRRVIDQVCLVSDVPSFLEALSVWDEQHFFPILIDSPAWSLPFLRAFRPVRVIRFARVDSENASLSATTDPVGATAPDEIWQRAAHALNRARSAPPGSVRPASQSDRARKRRRGEPGLVLTASDCPAFAGALALAAGHFQRVLRVAPTSAPTNSGHDPKSDWSMDTILSAQEAWQLVHRIEIQVAAAVPHYNQLGDDCDFLTLAVDWPYRYNIEKAEGAARGIYALDDLVGRRLDGAVGGRLDLARKRWAYAGRLVGDPAASVARAMAALFLQPKSALLWNTYSGGAPWSDYDMSRAAGRLRHDLLGTDAVEHRAARRADLANWHKAANAFSRFGLVFLNSSGGPQHFAIEGGPGRPADIPRGGPVAVCMIHSFSAADLANPQTIAGRWLAQGAYVFYGSVNEPFLPAFRQPSLVADLITAGFPFVAALRQGESERFGFPWRLIYLGDPLYRLEDRQTSEKRDEPHHAGRRMSPLEWQKIAPEYANWQVVELGGPGSARAAADTGSSGDSRSPSRLGSASEASQLERCLDRAIAESMAGSTSESQIDSRHSGSDRTGKSIAQSPFDWRLSLRSIERQRLERNLQPMYDELLIDALSELGADEELQSRLSQVPIEEKTPRIWLTIETCAASRLARLDLDLDRARGFRRALDLWTEVIQLPWPKGWSFPGQLTERMTAVASADANRRMRPWLIRLREVDRAISGRRPDLPHAEVVAAERARVEEKTGHHGLNW